MHKLALLLLCALLTACADDASDTAADTTTDDAAATGAATDAARSNTAQSTSDDAGGTRVETYECGEFRFTVRIENAMAHIQLPDRTVQLPLATTSTGSRYTDGAATFWENNGRASIELPEGSHYDCERALPVDTLLSR